MKQYKLVNNVLGWFTFFVAAFVYCSTTVSYTHLRAHET